MAKRHLLLACTTLAALLVCSSLASANMIVVGRYVSPTYKLYTMTPSGSMTFLANGTEPAVSPDGAKVAYSDSSYHLHIITISNGSDSQIGTFQGSGWAWSPDQTKLAYTWSTGLKVVNVDGSNNHGLGFDPSPGWPNWSPDGTKIVYQSYNGRYNLKSIASNGTTGTASTAITSPTTNQGDTHPQYSPDGSKIVFDSDSVSLGHWEVFSIKSDGTGSRTRLTYTAGTGYSRQPFYAAGGGMIYYLSHTSTSGNDMQVHDAASDGSGDVKLETDNVEQLSVQRPALPTLPSPTSSIHYVALGDSVAAGEGINYGWTWLSASPYGSWIDGLTSPEWAHDYYSVDNQHCHQSSDAYPNWLGAHLGVVSTMFWSYACTGASVANGLLAPQSFGDSTSTSNAQVGSSTSANLDYDNDLPDLVTITVGADDAHFADFMKSCYSVWLAYWSHCGTSSDTATASSYLATQASDLDALLTEVHSRGVTDGKVPMVVVTTYYNPFPSAYDGDCPDLVPSTKLGFGADLTSGEMTWLVNELSSLNQNIMTVASKYSNVVVVPLTNVFIGHGFCSSDPWVYGVSLRSYGGSGDNHNPAVFHPTAVGQQKIAQAIEAVTG